MAQDTLLTHNKLRNRYVFDGQLEMRTALHIGGGKETLSYADSPVVLTPEGTPFIPGSSFKGTLRSTIEKLVASLPDSLGIRSCGLPTEENTQETCPTARQKDVAETRRRVQDTDKVLAQARQDLCHTCQLFGSSFAAARITIHDLYLLNDEWHGALQIRDGVAIDRDSETAKKGAKYNFEVVPATTTFAMRVILENATEQDLQLISIGLSEFVHGFGGVGGLRSRGLGACELKELKITALELIGTDISDQERMRRMQRYLLHKELASLNTQEFFERHINALFAGSAGQR